jgi:hypothetical protein
VIYEPLAISTNILQASYTRLDHVLVTFGNLYALFLTFRSSNEELQSLADTVCTQVQKRFFNTDQDATIFAVFCNPYLRYDIFNGGSLSYQDLFMIANRLCYRFFNGILPNSEFMETFYNYALRDGEFSDESMHLDLSKQGATSKVRCNLESFYISLIYIAEPGCGSCPDMAATASPRQSQ